MARTYDGLGPEHVLTFASAEETMFWALQQLVGPGDHAVVTVPSYQSMESVTIATGADVDGLVLSPADGWALDLDARRSCCDRPELICVNFPNNPTGALPSRETFTRLVALCDEPRHPAVLRRGVSRHRTRSRVELNAHAALPPNRPPGSWTTRPPITVACAA